MKLAAALLALCIIPSFALALAGSNPLPLEKILNKSGLRSGDVGVFVTDGSGHGIFSQNGEKHFIPASISKLVTTAAVMNAFPPGTKFHTQIFTEGDVTAGVLNGDIYLKGNGDPAFVSEKMWMLVNDFTRSKIKSITGNIIADDSAFDSERFDPGREEDRNDRAYDAPVGALSFDWNSTTLYVRPGSKAGELAQVFVDPINRYVEARSEAKTSSHGTELTAEKESGADQDHFVIQGKIAVDAEEHHIYKNISNPPLYAAENLREFLKERGIEVAGVSKVGVVPKAAKLRADLEGEPLSRIISDMNKFSNNYVAEMLAKNLAAFKTGKQGRMSDGLAEIRNFLNSELGWSPANYNLANVSGFTRKNSFTPKQFTEVLSWLQKQFKIYPEFLQSLPIAGVDGTLHKRMLDPKTQGWVRAKTGLLNGVVALAGYAGSHDGSLKIFAFIYNGSGDEAHVRDTFDSMAASLVR